MKLYNFLFFVLTLYVAPLCPSNTSSTLTKIKSSDQAESLLPASLYEEMSSVLSDNNRRNRTILSFDPSFNHYSTDPLTNSWNYYRHRQQRVSPTNHNDDDSNDNVLVTYTTLTNEGSVSNNGPQDTENSLFINRPRGIEKLSVKTRVAFTCVFTLSMIELGLDIVDLYDYYYYRSQDYRTQPTFPIIKVVNSAIRNSLLYALYKFNEEGLS